MASKSEDLQKKNRRLQFVKLLATDYYMYAPPDCPAEDAGIIFQDLLVAIHTNTEPKYAVNKAAVDEARAYMARTEKRKKRMAGKERAISGGG